MRLMRHTDARLTMADYVDDEQVVMPEYVLPEVPVTAPAPTAKAVAAG
jgi:hypothetical protein